MNSNICEYSELVEFEIKLKDKLYELQTKRKVIDENVEKMQQIVLENHNLRRTLKMDQRETEEISIQLELAVGAARKNETERIDSRELYTRQKIQLVAAVKDRELLQERLKCVEVENAELKMQLQQAEKNLLNQNVFQERFNNKEIQWKKTVDLLAKEIHSTEQNQKKLMDIFMATNLLAQTIKYQLTDKDEIIGKIEADKNKLQDKLLILTDEYEKSKLEHQMSHSSTLQDANSNLLQEWVTNQEEMQLNIKEKEQEISQLQLTLECNFATMNFLKKKNAELVEEIERLNAAGKTCKSCSKAENNGEPRGN